MAGARPAPAPAADAGRGQAAAAAREPGPAALRGLRGPALDRLARPRPSSTASSRACRPRGCCCSSTTGPSTSTAGAARPTTPSCASIPCRPRAPGAAPRPPRRGRALHPSSAMLIERTEGNPFFLEESVRTLVETGRSRASAALSAGEGPRRHPGPGDGAGHPGRAHRPPLAGGQAPAPVGRGHRQGRALRAAGGDRGGARGGAAPRARPSPGGRVPLRDESLPRPRVHVQARADPRGRLRSLLHDRRRALHARIVEAIEALHADRLAEHVERLAHHALRGEAWEKAARYSSEAGQKAAARQAHREAVASFEQALAALGTAAARPPTDRTGHRPPAGHPSLAGVSRRLREYAGPSPAGGAARGGPGRPGPASCASPARLAHCLWVTGTVRARHSSRLSAPSSSPPGLAISPGSEARASFWARSGIRSATTSRRSRTSWSTSRSESLDESWRWRRGRAGILGRRAPMARSVAGRGRSVPRRRSRSPPRPWRSPRRWTTLTASPTPSLGLGFVLLRKGDVEQAIRVLERASKSAARLSFHSDVAGCAMPLGGRLRAVRPNRPRRIAVLRGCADRPVAPTTWDPGRELALLGGRMDEASQLGPQALEIARARRGAGRRPGLSVSSARSRRAASPRREAAEGHYRQALGLASELGMRPLVAHCHLGLGKLYRRTGQREEAQRAPHHRDDDVPRDGHAVLAGAGGSGTEGTGVIRSVTRRSFLAASLADSPRRSPLRRSRPGGYGGSDGSGSARPVRCPYIIRAFLQGLRDHGFVEGENVIIERRYCGGSRGQAHGIRG